MLRGKRGVSVRDKGKFVKKYMGFNESLAKLPHQLKTHVWECHVNIVDAPFVYLLNSLTVGI